MTIIIPAHRALTSKLAGRSYQVVTRYGYNSWLARVHQTSSSNDNIKASPRLPSSYRIGLISTRTYATTTAKAPVGRPKAHTGRTPAKKTTKASATKTKPGPKTAAGKAKVGRKPKTTKTKAKAKPKVKAPTVKKTPSKTALDSQRRARTKELREKALLDTPKQLPHSAYTVIFSEVQKSNAGPGFNIGEGTRQAAAKYNNLTPEEREHYNHIANQNKEKNSTAYKQWLNQYTPDQVREANNARRILKAQWGEKMKRTSHILKYPIIRDERLVKHPSSPFIYFSIERRASGDFHKMSLVEAASLIGREWNQLDAATKKQYTDKAEADHNRYVEETKTVYGIDFQPQSRKAAKAT